MPIVNVHNIGKVNFPDEMSHEDIVNAIETEVIPSYEAHVEKTGPVNAAIGAFKSGMGAANEGIAQPLESMGLHDLAEGRRKAAEEYKGEAAEAFEPTSDEEVAAAQNQGVVPGALKWAKKNLGETVGDIAGRYGVPTVAGMAAGALAPEAALGVGAARALGFIGTDIAPEMGENIEAAREAGTEEPSLIANVSGGLVEAAIGHYGLPITGKLAGTLFKRAEELAPRILSGELTREAAVKELGGFGINIAKEVGVNAASNAAAMTGIEATRRTVTGQDVTSPEALDKYMEGAKTAAILSPVFGGVHGVMNVRGARGALPEGRAEEVPVEDTAQPQPAMDENSGTININGQQTAYTKTGERDDGEPLYTVDVPMPDSTVLKQNNLTMADILEMVKAEPQAQAEGQPTERPAFSSDPAEHGDVTDSEVAQYITSVQEGSFDPVNDPTDAYMHEVMKMQKPEVIEYANSTVSPDSTRRRPVSDEDFDALRDEEAPEENVASEGVDKEPEMTDAQLAAAETSSRMFRTAKIFHDGFPAAEEEFALYNTSRIRDDMIKKFNKVFKPFLTPKELKGLREHWFEEGALGGGDFTGNEYFDTAHNNAVDMTLRNFKAANEKTAESTKEPKPSVATSDINTGHTAESLQPHFTPEMKRLVSNGKLTLHDTRDTLPGEDHPENVQGLTTPQGEVHLVASKLTPETLPKVAMHEMGVHVGMRGMVGDKVWDDLTSQALTTKGEAFDRARQAVPENTPEHLKGEETLAYLVENAPKLPIVKRAVSAIKNWARTTFGAKLSITESDIHHLAAKALRRESKTSKRSTREGTAYAQKPQDRELGAELGQKDLFEFIKEVANTPRENSRVGMPHEQILKRVPELTESAKKMMDMLYDNGMLVRGTKGNLVKGVSNKDVENFALANPEFRKLAEAHDALVEKYKPVEPYQSLPTPATEAEMQEALANSKTSKINQPIPDGYKVKLRLDIPAYKNEGIWVVTAHEGNTKKNSIFDVDVGKAIGYYGHAVADNPKFSIEEANALKIADTTHDKNPLATVDGEYVNMSAKEAKRLADEAMTDPDWVQVGMDPERHSYFYDRKTMQPIKSGSRVIQIGSILMVKDPVYGKKSEYVYSTHKDPLINDVFKESNRTTKVDSDPTLHESIAKAVKRYTPTRISWIDPTDKIGYLLRSLDTFDVLSKKLRADRLIQQTKQLGQVIRAVEELGVPVLKGDGTVGVKTDMRLALSEIHNRAVELGKKHKFDGPQLIDEVARTMLGKETLAEDAKLRAYGQHLKSLADTHKQTAKHMAAQGNYSVSEINKELRTADQLNKKAKEYLSIDREKVVTPAHITRIEAVMKKYPETKVILDDIRDLLRSHVELAHATGLIDAHTARKWNSKKDYIPMYKPEDLESFENEGSSWGIGMGSKTIKNAADYRREGHLHKINVWDNLQKHTALMVASSAQNEMRRTAVSQLSKFGEVVKAKDQGRTSVDGNLALYENGVKTWYIVKDPDALVAFQNFNYGAKPLMQMAGKMLRVGALYNPIYWYRQLVRDPLAANLVANVGGIVTPFHTVAQLAHILSGRSTNFKTLREHGVVGPVDLTHNYNSMQDQIGKAMSYDKNIWTTIKNQLIRVHEASDSATRVALYNNALKDAKKLGLSGQDAENYAAHRARDSINFAVHGTSEALHTIRVSTPFFSSTLNGLDTVYRAAKQHNLSPRESKELRNRFYSRALMMSTMTAMYTILLQDDEAYKDMPASEKDGNWLVPTGKDKNGKTIFFKVPAPFEVGFLFKTLPELMVNRLNGDATNKEVFRSVRDGLIANALPPIPIVPQLLKPLVETVTNYDLHNMRPIESANELNKMVESRGEGENAFYDWLSKDLKLKEINLSPKKVQHLWQGYFAQLGAVTASLADSLITSAKGEGKTPVNPESGLLKGILTDPTKSKYKTEFYDMANDAAKIVNSLNSYDSTGQGEKVKEMVAKSETKRALQVHDMSSKAELDIADIREAINTLKHRPDSPENREKIRNLKLTENKIAKSVVKASEKIK